MVQPPSITYFTCTLGQAALVNKDTEAICNIVSLINEKAKNVPHHPAVGFAKLQENVDIAHHESQRFTFQDVQRGIEWTATTFINILPNGDNRTNGSVVALLCPSTPEFVFAWLALIRLGYAVLLLAPQCQPSAVAHLCKECDVKTLLYDSVYDKLALDSSKTVSSEQDLVLNCQPLAFSTTSEEFLSALSKPVNTVIELPDVSSLDTAYLHHTSGTSTGLPKPIPQSHRAAIGVLPHRLDGSKHATFTTTPLYHGGVADLFRSWTSDAMIWLFPGKGVPITAKNINSCLDIADKENRSKGIPPVKYFSSVPYVLQMMAADGRGLQYLQGMDIVGVGGAALPAEVGDDLVKQGVNLISRFGSAECGFLMSSHRDYDKDKEWQYLRADSGAEALRFEQQEGGLSELVVSKQWPHRAKTNRPDSSLATADLFSPHASIPAAWRYNSRADSQLTLLTGKKFDPAPLESSIATSTLLNDVVIFGNGRPFPGALLFVSAVGSEQSEEDVIKALAPMVEKLNRESQDHARLARNMLVVMPHGSNRLEKSSKGTLLRNKAEEEYRDAIEGAYNNLMSSVSAEVADEDVINIIRENIESIIGKGKSDEPLAEDTQLFSYGVDSVASVQIRYTLCRLLPEDAEELPLSVVEDCGTVFKLADFILKRRHGLAYQDGEDELQLMHELVDTYGEFKKFAVDHAVANGTSHKQNKQEEEVVVLTGATGALGAHLLNFYRNLPGVSHIYCLVRGATPAAAHDRVDKSLIARGLPSLKTTTITAKVIVLPSKLSDPNLGLSKSDYATISSSVTKIAHLAWAVNFRPRLRSFIKDHICGLRHLILLALSSPTTPTFAFCSSVASVSSSKESHIAENPSHDPSTASPLGYSRSKWVAEAICVKAHTDIPRLRDKIAIFRVGQLSGDSERGVWNAKEAWPLMLGSVRTTGVLPDLGEGQVLDWLAVDVAAKAMGEVINHSDGSGSSTTDDTVTANDTRENSTDILTYHILNPFILPTWPTLLSWMAKQTSFRTVTPCDWIAELDKLQGTTPDHPALGLLGLWRDAYAGDVVSASDDESTSTRTQNGVTDEAVAKDQRKSKFVTTKTEKVSSTMRDLKPVDEEYFGRLWSWIYSNVSNGGA